jgi:hypothetical protein
MTTAILATLIALVAVSSAFADRSVEARISWLQERSKVHHYICRHGAHKTQRFHCLATGWTNRELKEAQQEKYNRDWTKPPEPYLSIARCEQGSSTGLWGVNWAAYSESYEGAFGFLHSTWRQYRSSWMATTANRATAREQLIVAKKLVATFHGYSSWPACHIKLGLPG